jgi:hypothetical protein
MSEQATQANSEAYLPAFQKASQRLDQLSFVRLKRPKDPEPVHPTRELVDWSIRMYCYSLLSHYREILRSFLLLTEGGGIPAAFVIARCLFEMGAHAHYVHKHVTQHLEGGNLDSAWRLLMEVNMGSRYMREKIAERTEEYDQAPFLEPREVAKVIRCFNEWGNIKQAVATYSFLSEFSHPNMGAFSHYYKMEKDEQEAAWVKYDEPPRDPLRAPLPEVAIALVATLHFVQKLLSETGEIEVAAQIRGILSEYTGLQADEECPSNPAPS